MTAIISGLQTPHLLRLLFCRCDSTRVRGGRCALKNAVPPVAVVIGLMIGNCMLFALLLPEALQGYSLTAYRLETTGAGLPWLAVAMHYEGWSPPPSY